MTMSADIGFDLGPGAALYQKDAAHPNPLFDYQTGFIPRKLKDVFKWSEYLSVQSAHIFAVIKKFGEYPITEIQYDSVSDGDKELRKELFEKILCLRAFMTEVSFDKFVYGNAFISIYRPFKRFLKCSSAGCGIKTDIKYVTYQFNLDKILFRFTCPSCRKESLSEPIDEKISDKNGLKLLRWDPKLIDIDYNPFSKESVYYYQIPRKTVSDVRNGARIAIDSTPREILESMQKRMQFRFAPGAIFHLKMPGPVGVESQWGLPPIIAAIKMFLFTATLRRANEAIAMEHITPFRVMFPQASGPNADPTTSLNLGNWRTQLQENYRRFRRDPLHIMIAPVPIGYQAIGGEGRALLTIAEIQEAEKNIVLSMGVPMEFLTGGLGQIRGEITLRMLENQLQRHVDDLNGMIQWIENETSRFFNRAAVDVHMAPFKMLDDELRQQMIMQLWQQKKVSDTTVNKMFDIDATYERKQIREDALADMRAQMETEQATQKLQNSLSAQAQSAAQQAGPGGVNYNDVTATMAAADQIVAQLQGLDEGSRRSQLDALDGEDPVMGAVVAKRLEQSQQNSDQAAKAQSRGVPTA